MCSSVRLVEKLHGEYRLSIHSLLGHIMNILFVCIAFGDILNGQFIVTCDMILAELVAFDVFYILCKLRQRVLLFILLFLRVY